MSGAKTKGGRGAAGKAAATETAAEVTQDAPAAPQGHTVPPPDFKLPLYGQLLASKLVVPSPRTGYYAVDQFIFAELVAVRLAWVEVDEAWYLEAYPDIQNAIDSGAVRSAAHHYRRFGFFEHRMPRRITVDEAHYLKTYPDVKEAIAKKIYATGQEHYMASGFREGRLPYPGFDLLSVTTPS